MNQSQPGCFGTGAVLVPGACSKISLCLFIAHDLASCHISDRVMVMYLGRIAKRLWTNYNNPKHIYRGSTELHSVPDQNAAEEVRVKGAVPNGNPPVDAYTRCPYAEGVNGSTAAKAVDDLGSTMPLVIL